MSEDTFDLSEVLLDYQNNPADVLDSFCSISDRDVDIGDILNELTDRLAVSPESIADNRCFGSALYLLHSFNDFHSKKRERVVDLILSTTTNQVNRGVEVLREEDQATTKKYLDLQRKREKHRQRRDSFSSIEFSSDEEEEEIVGSHPDSLINDVKERIERYCFLVYVLAIQIEKNLQQEVKGNGGSSGFSNIRKKSAGLISILTVVETILGVISQVLLILSKPLIPKQPTLMSRLFNTSSQRDVFVGMLLKPCYLLMENEVVLKDTRGLRQKQIFTVIAIAVVHFNQVSNIHTSLDQLFLYFEHLAEPMAELLSLLYKNYNNTTLCEEMLKEISSREINSNDNKGPKAVAAFLVKLSQLVPRLSLRYFTYIAGLLSGESFTIRSAVVESAGIILLDICKGASPNSNNRSTPVADNDMERHAPAIGSLFDLLEDRVLDINPYTRVRAIQALTSLTELNAKFSKRRPKMTSLAVQALQDKSSLVRKNSIRLLSRLISTHPFHYYNESGRLNLTEWEEKCRAVENELDSILPKDIMEGRATQESFPVADSNGQDENMIENQSDDADVTDGDDNEYAHISQLAEDNDGTNGSSVAIHDSETINKLQLIFKYHKEAIEFIRNVQEGLKHAQIILHSKVKAEVIEAMDIFVLADAYNIESARDGVRSMIHLVWAKGGGNNDEALAIQKHLLSCYQSLFFDPPIDASPSEANNLIARSLISLTYKANVSEITSLERLLGFAMSPSALAGTSNGPSQKQKENDPENTVLSETVLPTTKMVSDGVIKVLWKLYGYDQPLPRAQRRGAIIILGMLAKADPNVVGVQGLELLLKIGLGKHGREDFKLARYTCLALQRMIPEDNDKTKSSTTISGNSDQDIPPTQRKLSESHEVINRLATFMILPATSMEWFSVCEEAVNAIYAVCDTPNSVISHLLRVKTKQAFAPHSPNLAAECQAIGVNHPDCLEDIDNNSLLSQLLFFAGHSAIKTLVYLEKMEAQFKRRKMELDRERVEANERERQTTDDNTNKNDKGKGRRGRKQQQKPEDEEMTAEREFNLIGGGTTEDDFSEELAYIREDELMYGQQSLLARFGPLARDLCLEMIKDLQKHQRQEERRLKFLEELREEKRAASRKARYRRAKAFIDTGSVSSKYTEETLRNPIPIKHHSKMLVVAATLSLAKMMCVSSRFCEENLSVLLTMLEVTGKIEPPAEPEEPNFDSDDEGPNSTSSKRSRHSDTTQRTSSSSSQKRLDKQLQYQKAKQHYESEIEQYENASIVRSNIVLGLGDLAVQFNHVMEDNTQYVYRRLRDNSRMVQRTTLLTLTFLILAGQVKAKDQQLLGQMARCLEDSDKRIADLARIFFLELATKDNAIYNNFIDMFNSLVGYASTGNSESADSRKNEQDSTCSNADLNSDVEMEDAGSETETETSSSPSSATAKANKRRRESLESRLLGTTTTTTKQITQTQEDYTQAQQDYEQYQQQPDVVLSKEAVQRILKFLASLVDKERYIKQLSEKMAARLVKCESLEMWNYTSFVLGLLPHKNEEITKMVQNGFQKR